MSSPYVDYVWDGKPHLDITPSGLETLLQDVVVSTLSLNLSTNNRATQVLLGTDVYLFNEKVQFYAPYGSSLVVAFFICIYGAFCWWKNGAPAGSSMLQWLTTTAASKELNDLASKCPGGDGSTSEELELLEVKFVKGSFVTSANTAE